MGMGLHHFHIRKRIHKHHEPYPHPDTFKNAMDKAIYLVAIIGPSFTIPQMLKIWVTQNAVGVSAVSWGAFMLVSLFWLVYGILHREKPIVVANLFYLIFQTMVFIGTVFYGNTPFAIF